MSETNRRFVVEFWSWNNSCHLSRSYLTFPTLEEMLATARALAKSPEVDILVTSADGGTFWTKWKE
jgi:hypothetical protein